MNIRRAGILLTAAATGLVAALLAPPAAGADPVPAAASPCGSAGVFTAVPPTCTYDGPGTDTFTVPDGVAAVAVDLYGAEGGSAAGYVTPNPPNTGAPGGLGGRTTGTLPVTGGERLQITVGAAGTPGSSRRGEYARPGGYGHGAGGGGAHGGGGSGGGATDLRTGSFGAADRVLVAGGGGGAGNGGPLLHGGHGGGPAGAPGGQGGGPEGSGVAGGGATGTAHGTGSPNSLLGGPGIPGGDTAPNTGLPNPGSGGPGGNGARGGNGGGGGGGGWFGGGGGSGGGNPGNLYGAGGGGGSGHAAPTVTDARLAQGVRQGNGRAVVTFRYGTSLTLTTDTAAPLFGHEVTLTATVTPDSAAAGQPGGTVTFADGGTDLATVALTDGRATLSTRGLLPGGHTLTARYGGDPAYTPSTSPAPAEVTVGFSEPCVTTARTGTLTVGAGQALCIGPGGSQAGRITIETGGALAADGAALSGGITADGALALSLCGTEVTGAVRATGTTGPVRIGTSSTDTGSPACTGNTLRGPVTLADNVGGVEVSGSTVTGPLRCDRNEPEPVLTGTTVQGPRTGQCR
ncbi:Ig-like domain-containing protein [Streptomyces sp. NPDC101118]|uniref:Ig-like domain-containing protein n=1 Tax=Streptomyces sp. NPDC101118 TaxID=3366109 RepID=UPI00382099D5